MLSVIQWLLLPIVLVKVKNVSHLLDPYQNLQRISCYIKVARCTNSKKKRNTLSKVVGGKAITEDEVMDKIVEHQDKNKPKIKSRTGKSKQTVNINEVIPRKSKISTNSTSPVAGPSGVPLKKMKKVQIESCNSDSEEDIPDYEKCIICKQSSPDFSKKPFIIVNWGQCEKCNGWVHLSFCTKVRVLRMHTCVPFVNPLHPVNKTKLGYITL